MDCASSRLCSLFCRLCVHMWKLERAPQYRMSRIPVMAKTGWGEIMTLGHENDTSPFAHVRAARSAHFPYSTAHLIDFEIDFASIEST